MTLGNLIPNTLGSENKVQCFRKAYVCEKKKKNSCCNLPFVGNFKKGNKLPPSKHTHKILVHTLRAAVKFLELNR